MKLVDGNGHNFFFSKHQSYSFSVDLKLYLTCMSRQIRGGVELNLGGIRR